jgi:hypothetical protein
MMIIKKRMVIFREEDVVLILGSRLREGGRKTGGE